MPPVPYLWNIGRPNVSWLLSLPRHFPSIFLLSPRFTFVIIILNSLQMISLQKRNSTKTNTNIHNELEFETEVTMARNWHSNNSIIAWGVYNGRKCCSCQRWLSETRNKNKIWGSNAHNICKPRETIEAAKSRVDHILNFILPSSLGDYKARPTAFQLYIDNGAHITVCSNNL